MSRKSKILLEGLYVEKVVAVGKCLARWQEAVVFIEGNVAPGDVIDAQVYKKKKNYWNAFPVNYHKFSELRQTPFCKHYGVCGGCKWQHLGYPSQLQYKQQEVIDAFERIGKVEGFKIHPIISSQNTQFYRNKLEFTFSNSRWLTTEELSNSQEITQKNALGFHVPERFDKIVDIQECFLQNDLSNRLRNGLRKFTLENNLTFFDLRQQTGLLRNLVIRTSGTTPEVMVVVIFAKEDAEAIDSCMIFLKENFPEITSLQYIINTKKNDSYHDLESFVFHGLPYITETMETLSFRVSVKSFYQTNSLQAYELYKVARDFAGLKGHEIVYDLYTGTGTIANFVASKAKKVVGLEYVASAVEDAKTNSQINGIAHTDFFAGDLKDLLTQEFIVTHGKPDVVITDPPRAGMHENVVKVLLDAEPECIVYVSCNPATQARDVALLSEKYLLTDIQPVDMFPHTFHVENVARLIRKF